jgi:hypothetical protein
VTVEGIEGGAPPVTALRVLASPADAGLAGPSTDLGAGPLVVLGDAEPGPTSPAVRWLDREPRDAYRPAERTIAPAGERLWRRAPWPAADALFDLAPPRGEVALLVGADGAAREAILERAAARGVVLELAERLDAPALARCACVVFAASPGAALPARAPAVLAARRLLIVPRLETTFGLQDGLDHLQFADPDMAVTFVEAYRRGPAAFARMLVLGAVAARPQRASVVYGRLAADLRLEGAGASS